MEAFIAIDYETANSHHESACALGVSIVENGEVIDSAESLIKPPKEFSDFDPFNTMIHGIQKKYGRGFKISLKNMTCLLLVTIPDLT